MRPIKLRRRIAVAGTIGVTALIATLGLGAERRRRRPGRSARRLYPGLSELQQRRRERHPRHRLGHDLLHDAEDRRPLHRRRPLRLHAELGRRPDAVQLELVDTVGSPTTRVLLPGQRERRPPRTRPTTGTAPKSPKASTTSGPAPDRASSADRATSPRRLPVDFARSSKPVGTSAWLQRGRHRLRQGQRPRVDFQINPLATAPRPRQPYASVNGGASVTVATGGCPVTRRPAPTAARPFTNISNTDNGGGPSSTAYRLWCATGCHADHRLGSADQPRAEPGCAERDR